jgi:hypothetical protein
MLRSCTHHGSVHASERASVRAQSQRPSVDAWVRGCVGARIRGCVGTTRHRNAKRGAAQRLRGWGVGALRACTPVAPASAAVLLQASKGLPWRSGFFELLSCKHSRQIGPLHAARGRGKRRICAPRRPVCQQASARADGVPQSARCRLCLVSCSAPALVPGRRRRLRSAQHLWRSLLRGISLRVTPYNG